MANIVVLTLLGRACLIPYRVTFGTSPFDPINALTEDS